MHPRLSISLNDDTSQFVSLDTFVSDRGLPSSQKPNLQMKLTIKKPFTILLGVEEVSSTSEIFPLSSVKCLLVLKDPHTNKGVEINLDSVTDRWYFPGYCEFSREIDRADMEWLRSYLGKSVRINWDIMGYAFVDTIPSKEVTKHVITLTTYPKPQDVTYGVEELQKKLLQPLKLDYEFIRRLSSRKIVICDSGNLPRGIGSLIPLLDELQFTLNGALYSLRNANNSEDFRGSLASIRTTLDSIKEYSNSPSFKKLAKEIYLDNGSIKEIGKGSRGKTTAAEQLVNDLWTQFRSLFNILSKTIHTKAIQTVQPANYIMYPDRSDVEYLLTACLNITNYLIDKIDKTSK